MTHFAVYDRATGAIRRYGSCTPCDLMRQASEGEGVIETDGPVRGDLHRVDITAEPPVIVAARSANERS